MHTALRVIIEKDTAYNRFLTTMEESDVFKIDLDMYEAELEGIADYMVAYERTLKKQIDMQDFLTKVSETNLSFSSKRGQVVRIVLHVVKILGHLEDTLKAMTDHLEYTYISQMKEFGITTAADRKSCILTLFEKDRQFLRDLQYIKVAGETIMANIDKAHFSLKGAYDARERLTRNLEQGF